MPRRLRHQDWLWDFVKMVGVIACLAVALWALTSLVLTGVPR